MSRSPRVLVVATTNPGKLGELRSLLAGVDVTLHLLEEFVLDPPAVVEDGGTFADNARKKAWSAARASGLLALADDSGLEVDALAGQPGVRSARFAGDRATDAENNAALVAALDACGSPEPRSARFRCVLAVVDPVRGEAWTADGACEGKIVRTPRGSGGFGYDPLFVVAGGDRTMAELSTSEKNLVSHRARAVSALEPLLARILSP